MTLHPINWGVRCSLPTCPTFDFRHHPRTDLHSVIHRSSVWAASWYPSECWRQGNPIFNALNWADSVSSNNRYYTYQTKSALILPVCMRWCLIIASCSEPLGGHGCVQHYHQRCLSGHQMPTQVPRATPALPHGEVCLCPPKSPPLLAPVEAPLAPPSSRDQWWLCWSPSRCTSLCGAGQGGKAIGQAERRSQDSGERPCGRACPGPLMHIHIS